MSQEEQLDAITARFTSAVPEAVRKLIADGHAAFLTTFDASKTIHVGDKLPPFTIPDATGKPVSSVDLLAAPGGRFLLVVFYRGEWCPYCNVAVASLQKHLPDFEARGVTLVAVSPELPNGNLSMTEKHALRFPVLTDLRNGLARRLGIVKRTDPIVALEWVDALQK
ncbi:thioredoxin-like protein [Xylariaceae sp. FL0016]|nr:thioredoxin-like protein [Xylariaceae sp. FL0016]